MQNSFKKVHQLTDFVFLKNQYSNFKLAINVTAEDTLIA